MAVALLPFAERLLGLEEEARSQVRQALGRGARLALAATPTTSTYTLPPILRLLHQQYPEADQMKQDDPGQRCPPGPHTCKTSERSEV